MGIFSSKKETQVATSILRVVEDHLVPNSPFEGLVSAIFEKRPIAKAIQETLLNSTQFNFERMYRYAASGAYYYGLPNVISVSDGKASNDQWDDQVRAAIESEVGTSIQVDYEYFRPMNNVHVGWKEVTENYGYNHETNELESLSVQKGFPVYLDDLVAVYPEDYGIAYTEEGYVFSDDMTGFGVWGRSPRWGYTPERPARTTASGLGDLVLEETLKEGSPEGVEIHYVWEDSAGDIQKEFIFLDLSSYSPDIEYFQAKYRYTQSDTEKEGYWFYEPGVGTYPAVDELFALPYVGPGTYFPFIVFRRNHINRTANEFLDTEEFQSTGRLLDILGADFKGMGDSIHENPGIEDVEQAVMLMAVPLKTQHPIEMDYLWRFCDRLYELTPPVEEESVGSLTALSSGERSGRAFIFRDADFILVLDYHKILRKVHAGSIGEIGTVVREDATVGQSAAGKSVTHHKAIFYKQVTASAYVGYHLTGARLRYQVGGRHSVMAGENDENLLIPIDRNIAHQFNLVQREQLYYRSLHLVTNALVKVKLEWYEQESFRLVLFAVAVLITIKSLFSDKGLLVKFATALADAAVITLVKLIIKTIIKQYVFKVLARTLGAHAAFVIAVLLVFAEGTNALGITDIGVPEWAGSLLEVATGLAIGTQAEIKRLTSEYKHDVEEFNLYKDTQIAELEYALTLLDSNDLLSSRTLIHRQPLYIPGETPEDFYDRTIHAGNVGALSFEIIENFVDINLRLPGIQETIGDTFYV
jgi:hypothetical protein